MLKDGLTQIQFDIQNISFYIDTLPTIRLNLILINPPDLQHLLYDIKDQLRSHPRLDLTSNINTDIFKTQAFALMDNLFVILSIPFVDTSMTFFLYKIHNLP